MLPGLVGRQLLAAFVLTSTLWDDGMSKVIFPGLRVDLLETGFSGLIHNITEKCVSHFHSVQPAQVPDGLELAKARRCFPEFLLCFPVLVR